jgi:hypothetical protein
VVSCPQAMVGGLIVPPLLIVPFGTPNATELKRYLVQAALIVTGIMTFFQVHCTKLGPACVIGSLHNLATCTCMVVVNQVAKRLRALQNITSQCSPTPVHVDLTTCLLNLLLAGHWGAPILLVWAPRHQVHVGCRSAVCHGRVLHHCACGTEHDQQARGEN